jgi:hypothetical protein
MEVGTREQLEVVVDPDPVAALPEPEQTEVGEAVG